MEKRAKRINGLSMAYVEVGTGDPIVFLHGNPTSSYLWRGVIPHLADRYRCVAPDLIGMGDSDPLPESGQSSYTFVQHREYLDGLLDALDLGDRITFVVHDWGGALGFDWARRHPDRVLGIAYMETIVTPLSWRDWPEDAQRLFQGFRSNAGDELILERNLFIERVLPASIIRELTAEEMQMYRKPYVEPGECRRPTLTWPRQIPIDGKPSDTNAIVSAYSAWLMTDPMPKLFINAEPGSILTGRQREFARRFPSQVEVTVPGIHFIQEDSPDAIGSAVAQWRAELGPKAA
ncbi:MAG: haloalkane dehalogenase [Acidimicrobiia bacterium]|nr:haloalkane dehalogenase [Acidimicrobiia bacterium]